MNKISIPPNLTELAYQSVVDRELFVYRTNRNSSIRWMMKMGGTPSEKPEVYRKANILLSIDKVKTPVLIMHGEDDPQVPPSESPSLPGRFNNTTRPIFISLTP